MRSAFTFPADYDAHTFTHAECAGPDSHDRKAPPPQTIYPNLNDYARIGPEEYHSRERMALEWERIWTRVWTCAGRVSDIPQPGNFFRYDLGRESFIITRAKDNQIRALYNVCQHRGRQLVDADMGSRLHFTCPFHGWAYELTGKLKSVTDRPTFTAHALCGDLNLKQARCEVWAGFVFINMDPDAPALADYLGEIVPLMAAYRMEDMHVVQDVTVEIDCNWKTGLEAFIETYHVHATHPQTLPGVDDVSDQIDIYPNGHGRMLTPFAVSSPRLGARREINPFLGAFLTASGLDPKDFAGNTGGIRDAIVQAKLRPDNVSGLDYSRFTRTQMLDIWAYNLFPNFTLNAHPEGVFAFQFSPHPTDPEKFFYRTYLIAAKLREGVRMPFYFGLPDDTDVSGSTRPPRRWAPMGNAGIGEVVDQDISNLRAVQRGLHSRAFAGGNRYSELETRLQVFHAEADLYLQGLK